MTYITALLRGLRPSLIGPIAFLLVASACSSPSESSPSPTSVPAPTSIVPTPASGQPAILRIVLASSDLAVGPNRFAFGILEGTAGQVRVSEAKALFFHIDTSDRARAQATARFIEWPTGRAGVYVATVEFDLAGRWGVVAEIAGEDGRVRAQSGVFEVKQESSSPAMRQRAPASVSRTAKDVADLAEITTSAEPDPDLYEMTIAEAVASGRPTVVTFATPAFCRTATCGPQVEVISDLKERFKPRANFIHVEVYDNPREIEGDLTKLRLSPLMAEWGLQSEPFTFVIDGQGLIAAKFEGFVTDGELDAALRATLDP